LFLDIFLLLPQLPG